MNSYEEAYESFKLLLLLFLTTLKFLVSFRRENELGSGNIFIETL